MDEALKSTTEVSAELVRAASIPLHRDEPANDWVPEELVRYSNLLSTDTVASLSHRVERSSQENTVESM